jgi:hypothetical protein
MIQKKIAILHLARWFLVLVGLMIGCARAGETGPFGTGGFATQTTVLDGSVVPSKDAGGNSDIDAATTSNDDASATANDGSSTATDAVTARDASCGAVTTEAKRVEIQVPFEVAVPVTKPKPFAIYIMLDRSGSMIQNGSTKWSTAVSALKTFVVDPKSSGIFASAQVFPRGEGDENSSCDGTTYRTPYFKNIQLPDTSGTIATLLSDSTIQPGGTVGGNRTPMEGALRGLTSYCAAFQVDTTNNPTGMKCVGVLITDGQPTICDQDPTNLIAIAGNAKTNTNVTTYAVGMEGADFDFLGRVAQAGGAKDCDPAASPTTAFNACNVGATTDGGVPQMTLLEALELVREYSTEFETHIETKTEVRTTPLDCEWAIPAPPQNEKFDKDKVNVNFSASGSGTDTLAFGRVASEQACGDSSEGWYYDDANTPTKVMICPKACDAIKAAEQGSINVLFGCQTIVIN